MKDNKPSYMYIHTRTGVDQESAIFFPPNQYDHGHTGGTYGGDPEYIIIHFYCKGQMWLLKATLSMHSNVGGEGGGTGVQSNQNKHVDIQHRIIITQINLRIHQQHICYISMLIIIMVHSYLVLSVHIHCWLCYKEANNISVAIHCSPVNSSPSRLCTNKADIQH